MKADTLERDLKSLETSIKSAVSAVKELTKTPRPMRILKVKDRLQINRFGVLVADKNSLNQCKQVYHTHYEYQISAKCGTELDSNGFIINHTDIDRVVQDAFHREMDSCEVLLIRIIDAVHNLMNQHRVKVFEIYGRLQPIPQLPTKEYAFMEMRRELDDKGKS